LPPPSPDIKVDDRDDNVWATRREAQLRNGNHCSLALHKRSRSPKYCLMQPALMNRYAAAQCRRLRAFGDDEWG